MVDPTTDPVSDDPGERRSSTRRACVLQVRYRGAGAWHPATVVDLSTRGCRLRVGEDLPRSSAIRVAFTGPAHEGASAEVEAAGTVMWCRLEGLSYQAGIHFSHERTELEQLLG
jgi:hypothetical protein